MKEPKIVYSLSLIQQVCALLGLDDHSKVKEIHMDAEALEITLVDTENYAKYRSLGAPLESTFKFPYILTTEEYRTPDSVSSIQPAADWPEGHPLNH